MSDIKKMDKTPIQLEFIFDESPQQKYTNTFSLFDAIPIFWFSKNKELKGNINSNDMVIERDFIHAGQKFTATINPASIKRTESGKKTNIFVWMGKREEMVLYALLKLLSQQENAKSEKDNQGATVYGVNFSLYEIQKMLSKHKFTLNTSEVREAIEILHKSNIELKSSENGEEILNSPILTVVAFRGAYGKKASVSQSYVRFNPLIDKSIKELTSRQFSYPPLMTAKHAISRYLIKRMADRFQQAATNIPYTIKLSTLFEGTGLPWNEKMSNNKRYGTQALDELIKLDIANDYTIDPIKSGRAAIDYKIDIYPSDSFSNDTIRANARSKLSEG